LRRPLDRFDFGGSWLPDAEHGPLRLPGSPMAAIRRSRIELVIASIAHAGISLCSMVD